MINKLKVIGGSAKIYYSNNNWELYKSTVLVIKSKILSGEIEISSVNYSDNFAEKYHPYTDDKNWGSNLDEYILTVDFKYKATITYYSINRYASYFENRVFKFKIDFNLPKELLVLFERDIESEFYYKCVEIREKELEKIEEDRIREIGQQLLKTVKNDNKRKQRYLPK